MPAAPEPLDLSLPPLVDHHCHGLLRGPLDRAAFEAHLTEAARPAGPGTTYFDTQAGFAVRRWCAPELDLPAHCAPEEYLARRAELGPGEVRRRLLAATGIATFLVDTGLPGDLTGPQETASSGGPVHSADPGPGGQEAAVGREIVRLETLAERLTARATDPAELLERIGRAVTEAAGAAAGFKSVAAYRHGLALAATPPESARTLRAARAWLAAGGGRLTDPVLLRHLLWLAVRTGRPLQLHTGLGDPDLRIDHADPALLTDFARATADTGTPLVLLHCYPYHRQAAYLASVFPHVHADVGLALTHTGPRAAAVLAEFLELAPFGKLLFSTDAYALPEHYLLGSRLFRRALAQVLTQWVDDGAWSAADARRVAAMVAAGNARRVYGTA
ncbi:amidohydrolase family protein [Streptomyces sp. NPDC059740]|uniref:amidohydrolase family protein n=1 Tax=Streptomyces sp. NPDC059740 TaxID=3346926 RepID=UPI00366170FC